MDQQSSRVRWKEVNRGTFDDSQSRDVWPDRPQAKHLTVRMAWNFLP